MWRRSWGGGVREGEGLPTRPAMRSPPRGLLAIQGFRGFQCTLLCDGVRIFENSPPFTEVWLRYASPQVASLINGVDDRRAVNERRRSRSVFPRSGTSLAGGERPIDQKPSRCDGLTRNHKISSRKEPPVAYANRPRCKFGPSRTDHVAKSTRRAPTTSLGRPAVNRPRCEIDAPRNANVSPGAPCYPTVSGVSTRVAMRWRSHFWGFTPVYRGVAALRFATSRFAH